MGRQRWLPAVIALAGLICGVNGAQAQQQSTKITTPPPQIPLARAVRATPDSPRLDGRLDDPAWQQAPLVTSFTQRDPNEGQPGTEKTEARIVYSDAAVYVGVRVHDPGFGLFRSWLPLVRVAL